MQAASWRAAVCPNSYPLKPLTGGSYRIILTGEHTCATYLRQVLARVVCSLMAPTLARNLLENTPYGGEWHPAWQEALQEAQILSDNPQVTRAIATMNILDGMMAAFPAVQITGLSGRPELNGEIGQVGPRVDDVTDRYPVTLASGKKLNVRVINLRAARRRSEGSEGGTSGGGGSEGGTRCGDNAGGGGDNAGGGGDNAGGGSPTTLGSDGAQAWPSAGAGSLDG